jgi:hypothetical protein
MACRLGLPVLWALVTCAPASIGQDQIEISEPATVNIVGLFKQADLVAVIRILSGDSEHYATTVYKAEVVTAFKGAHSGEKLYFGPFISYGVGSEYLAFLRRSDVGLNPAPATEGSGLHYGAIGRLFRVMYEGYSIMPIEYVCVFEGKEPSEQCADAIKVNAHQVRLPRALRTYPAEPAADLSGSDEKWVKKEALLSALVAYAKAQ